MFLRRILFCYKFIPNPIIQTKGVIFIPEYWDLLKWVKNTTIFRPKLTTLITFMNSLNFL